MTVPMGWKIAILLVPALLAASGCVERKLLIRTEPPGAVVALNREEPLEAATPLEIPFSFYGTYAVRLSKEGFLDLETTAPMDPPWWSWPPFDFFTEILWPFTIEDRREFTFALEPLPAPRDLEEAREWNRKVVERGEELRREVSEEETGETR